MTMATKTAIFQEYKSQYWMGSKQEKQAILTHICFVTSMHRKSAIRKFSALQCIDPATQKTRGRQPYYTPDVTVALRSVWKTASEICAELLHPVVSEYVSLLVRDHLWNHPEETTKKVLSMSEATMKRRIAGFVREHTPHHGMGTTNPSALKLTVPIFTGPWEGKPPGYGQIDTVAHCGSSVVGEYAFTLHYTDAATLWSVQHAQWNKGKEATRESMKAIQQQLPFPWLGAHPDTGSEFINDWVITWCRDQQIELTRSRPNHKNDNMYIEERNGHIVRKFVGYTRWDTREAVDVLNKLYDVLIVYTNHFVPVRKCMKKEKVGSRYIRRYDIAKTPYQRVMENPVVSERIKRQLKAIHDAYNPWHLKQEIDRITRKLYDIQKRHVLEKNLPPVW
jgi:hypothetical protein